MITRTFSFLLISLSLTACTLLDPEANLKSERELWEEAQGHMDGRRHLQAIMSLEELDRRFPFGQYADGTQLDLVYAYFKSSKYELARLTADRFIRLNPDHPEADYAQYMKGLSSYASNDSMVSRYLPGDETGRDIGGARDAINDFTQLLTRYPDSEFKEDATLRLIYVRNQLAEVARARRQEAVEIPADFDFAALTGLAGEARQKLGALRPRTLGAASRIDGVRPPDIALLAVHLERARRVSAH